MDERDRAFFEDIGVSLDLWVEVAVQGLTDPASTNYQARGALTIIADALRAPEQREAFEAVLRETLTGLAHSIMVTLDGGSEYSEGLGSPQLRHGDGQPFVAGLHEWLFDHLSRTGRLR
jgi:hypothetical protein